MIVGLALPHPPYSLFGHVCFPIWGHSGQFEETKKKKEEITHDYKSWQVVKKASDFSADSKVEYIVMYFISTCVTVRNHFRMPLMLNESFLKKALGIFQQHSLEDSEQKE